MTEMCKYLTTFAFAMTSYLIMTSSATEYVAGVQVYVDKSGMDNWVKVTGKSGNMEFWREMNSTFFEINQILKTLQPYGVNIRMQIADIFLLDQDILTADRNGKIINDKSLTQFENFVTPRYAQEKHDLAILFTGRNLVRSRSVDAAFGYGYLGTVCSGTALAVVELHATYMDVLAAVHEIGHIIGAPHDGAAGATGCGSQSGEIMNAMTLIDSPKHFFFSSCSAKNIRNTLNSLPFQNCLSSGSPDADIRGPRFGSLMSPDDLCKRTMGPTSYLARIAHSSYGDDICTKVACMKGSTGRQVFWVFAPTPQGLNCGKYKQCVQGKCVRTDFGSAQVSDTCPFGDQPKLEGGFLTSCSQVSRSQCSNWKNACCQTCGNGNTNTNSNSNSGSNQDGEESRTADEICRDLVDGQSSLARLYYTSYGDNLCSNLACLTGVDANGYFRWSIHSTPEGMKCGQNKRCSSGQCRWSRTGDQSMSDTCPYGDQTPWVAGGWLKTTCPSYVRQYGCYANGMKQLCCGSC